MFIFLLIEFPMKCYTNTHAFIHPIALIMIAITNVCVESKFYLINYIILYKGPVQQKINRKM